MTNKEWMDKVRQNWDTLVDLVMAYHPRANYSPAPLPITAGGAEAACEIVRRQISSKGQPVTVGMLEQL